MEAVFREQNEIYGGLIRNFVLDHLEYPEKGEAITKGFEVPLGFVKTVPDESLEKIKNLYGRLLVYCDERNLIAPGHKKISKLIQAFVESQGHSCHIIKRNGGVVFVGIRLKQ